MNKRRKRGKEKKDNNSHKTVTRKHDSKPFRLSELSFMARLDKCVGVYSR